MNWRDRYSLCTISMANRYNTHTVVSMADKLEGKKVSLQQLIVTENDSCMLLGWKFKYHNGRIGWYFNINREEVFMPTISKWNTSKFSPLTGPLTTYQSRSSVTDYSVCRLCDSRAVTPVHDDSYHSSWQQWSVTAQITVPLEPTVSQLSVS